ncbi:MAG: ammonia-forming cytochrome c nitrite reductase subunit c552, partial [Bacteroidales bacterium]
EKEMKGVLKLLRQAQWRWDFVVASHGSTFHAPVESQRILAHGLDKAMQAQLELQKVLFTYGVHNTNLPDISTKAKAQKYIGLDMDKLNKEKKDWINTTVPKWLEQAKKEGKLSKL